MTARATSHTPPTVADEDRLLRDYLADHDLACPDCNYNLRGAIHPQCPECGLPLRLPSSAAPPGSSEKDRMVRWLRDHDLICRKCGTNMRGRTSNACPTCSTTYMLQHGDSRFANSPSSRPHPAHVPLSAARILLLVLLAPVILLIALIITVVMVGLLRAF